MSSRDVSWSRMATQGLLLLLLTWPAAASTPAARESGAGDGVNPQLMVLDAVVGAYGNSTATSGIEMLDLEGDGLPEIFVGSGDEICALSWDPRSGSYPQRWFVDYGPVAGGWGVNGNVARIAVGDIGGSVKVVGVKTDGTLFYLDAGTGWPLLSHPAQGGSTYDLALAELDGQPGLEVVVLSDQQLAAYRYPSPQPLWSTSAVKGRSVAVGQMDTDGGLEVAVGDGTGPGVVWDIASATVQWSPGFAFGRVATGDVDGDGRDEIATAPGSRCYVYDVDAQTQKWSSPAHPFVALRVVDVTGDGVAEVVAAEEQWGPLRAYDGTSGSELWSISNILSNVAAIAAGDLDGDCDLELMWGTFTSNLGESSVLLVADIATGSVEWNSEEADGHWYAVGVGDVDGDGSTELVRVSSQSGGGQGGARAYVTDLHHRVDEAERRLNGSWLYTDGLGLGQLDGDPALEFVVHDGSATSRNVAAYDGATLAREWSRASIGLPKALAVGDPDGDGANEVLMGSSSGDLFQLRGVDGSTEWQATMIAGSWVTGVRVADVDADGTNEIVAASDGGMVRVYDGMSHAVEWTEPAADVSCLDVGDVDGDGDPDIVVGTLDGRLTAWDGAAKSVLFSGALGNGSYPVNALRIADVDGDGRPDLAFACDNSTETGIVGVLDVRSFSIVWTSPTQALDVGSYDSLLVDDADDDGKTEIVVATRSAIQVYEYDADPVDVQPPIWDGAVGVQSVSPAGSRPCCPALDVSWGTATDDRNPPITYHLFRGSDAGFSPTPQARIASIGGTSYRDDHLPSGTTYFYLVMAADAAGNLDGNLVRVPGTTGGIAIGPGSLAAGTIGAPYSQTLSASGGTAPYTFTLSSGALPLGLSLSQAGVVAGTPTAAGTFGFTVAVQDAAACAGTASLAISITDPIGGAAENLLIGAGLGMPNDNRVKIYLQDGTPAGVDFLAYGSGSWGVGVAGADIGSGGGGDHVLTGPGPGTVFGPHVRAFFRGGQPIAKVSFYAYGTLRFGVNASAAELDADGFEEIVTGAGAGAVFGPHVRAWNFDGATVTALAKINFFAYGTLKYGVNATGGRIDGDAFAELLTGPGPGVVFSPQVRGFDYDGSTLRPLARVNFNAFTTGAYGVNLASGDVEQDGFEEIGNTPGPGPGPAFASRFIAFDFDASTVAPVPGFDVTLAGATTFGGRVGFGDVTGDGRDDLLAGAGRDPAATANIHPFLYLSLTLTPLLSFDPFPGNTYGVNPGAGAYGF